MKNSLQTVSPARIMDAIINKAQVFVARRTPWLQSEHFYRPPESDLAVARQILSGIKTNFLSIFPSARMAYLFLKSASKIAATLAIWGLFFRARLAFQHKQGKNFQEDCRSCLPESASKWMLSIAKGGYKNGPKL